MLKPQTALEIQIHNLEISIEDNKKKQAELSKIINKELDELNKLIKDNPNLKPKSVKKRIYITTHFIDRYNERITSINTPSLKKKLLKDYSGIIYELGGNCKIIHEGYALIVRDYTFITVHKIDKNVT
jgi:hypothetical protein